MWYEDSPICNMVIIFRIIRSSINLNFQMYQCFQYYYQIETDTNNDYNKEDVLVSDITEAENNDSNKVFFWKI